MFVNLVYVCEFRQLSDVWDLYFQFDGARFVHKRMKRCDIRYLNLLSVMEAEGYGITDSIYYVKHEGEGLNGLELIDSNIKVDEMVRKYEMSRKVVLTVMRDKRVQAIVVSPMKKKSSVHIDLEAEFDDEPVPLAMATENSVYCQNVETELGEHVPVDFLTQESVYAGKKQVQEEENQASDDDQWAYPCEFDPEEAEAKRKKEEEELLATIAEMRKKRKDPLLHYEGDTDIEDIFDVQEDPVEVLAAEKPLKKPVKRPGPTVNSHSQVVRDKIPQWVPSDDEGEQGFLKPEEDDGFEPLPFIQPKGRKSRAKKPKERVWYDETRMNAEQQFQLFLCFRDVSQFREALSRLHIVQVRNYHFHRNTPDRIIVWCNVREEFGCQFYMVASKITNEQTFCIKKLELEHTCPTNPASSRVNSKWLSTAFVDNYRSDINTGISTVQDQAKKAFGVEVPKRMAYRARTKAREIVLGDHKKQYYRLRDYLQTVIDVNPGSRCIVTTVTGPTEDQIEAMKKGRVVNISYAPRFHGLFFCVNAAREGFLAGCRPFLGLDGCFIKLTTGAQILAATGRDGNNNIFPIAWAVVAKEDTENWQWFLEQLKEALGGERGQFGYYTIMSDRQKGLIKAVTTVFPNCPQRFCLRHIYANFQTAGFRGEDLKKCMDKASYSYTKDGSDEGMEEMKKQCLLAWEWLSKIPVHTWARWAFDTNCKTDLVNNNISEVFNKYILDVRNKPIVTMLVGIYDKGMMRHDNKREGGRKASWEITPHYAEQLELMKKYSRDCEPKRADLGLWQVKSGKRTHSLDLNNMTCSCRKWQLSGLPCNHAVAAIYKSYQHPEDFVSDFFKKEFYLKSYMPVFQPMPAQHGWTKTNLPDIMPPGFKDHLKGRRQEKRRKGKFEVPKPKETSRMATITCGNCKLQGHKYTSCSMPLRPDLQMRKNNHKANRREMPDAPTPPQPASRATTTTAPIPPQPPSRAAPTPTQPASRAAPRPYMAPRSATRPAPEGLSSQGSGTTNAGARGGFSSYFNAARNAGPGRDPSVGPLDGRKDV